MSTISSLIYVNPIEPGPFSLRIPAGLETRLDVTFYDQLGVVYNVDLAAQIELTPRTNGGPQTYYAMPAIDAVNGKARAILPANTLTDRNGYRLNLYGTVRGEAMLIARGVIDVLEAPGTMSFPVDLIDSIDLIFTREEPVSLDVNLWVDVGKNTEYDLAQSSVTANVYTSQGGVVLTPFTVTIIDNNTVKLSLTADQVNTLPDYCWWNLVTADVSGSTTLAEGKVTVIGELDAPLPVTTADWEYLVPATLEDPLTGQIIHSSITQNVLRISCLDYAGIDQVPLLADLEQGDRITIGATTWTVFSTAYNGGGWYEVIISPVVQELVAAGVVPVLFEPPL